MRSKREALLRRLAAAALSAAVLVPAAALAGPPFRTDDPEPVEYQHWEFYSFTAGTHVDGDTAGVAPAAEFNYGLFPNAMVHIVVPTTAFDHPTGSPSTWGLGDVELGFKYRLLEQDKTSWKPSIGIFPLLELPTGDQSRTLGAGHTRMFLPVWAQKDFGDWTTYGGGGYWINQNDTYGSKNYWFVGWLLQRKITDKLTLGGEIYHQTADLVGGFDTTGFNLGGQLDLDEHNHLLFSAGRGFQNAAQTNLFSWYLGWQVTY
jgi:hypothetical protein